MELIYAKANNLSIASVKNRAGNFVTPSMDSVTHAATGSLKTIPDDFRVSITDSAGKQAYPISGFTYILVYQTPADTNKAGKLVRFLKWSLGDGQKLAATLHYAPLPKELIKKILTRVDSIRLRYSLRRSDLSMDLAGLKSCRDFIVARHRNISGKRCPTGY